MLKNMFKGASVLLVIMAIAGCSTTDDIKVRNYVEVKKRVDQNMKDGNAGYLSGTPQPEDRSTIRKTRKIYVLEVSKSDKDEPDSVVRIEDPDMTEHSPGERYTMEESVYEAENVIEVSGDDGRYFAPKGRFADGGYDAGKEAISETVAEEYFVEYTIKKDDTLQKISKKFYDSYSMWPKIHQANRDVIKDPNRIKPGVVLQIPLEK